MPHSGYDEEHYITELEAGTSTSKSNWRLMEPGWNSKNTTALIGMAPMPLECQGGGASVSVRVKRNFAGFNCCVTLIAR